MAESDKADRRHLAAWAPRQAASMLLRQAEHAVHEAERILGMAARAKRLEAVAAIRLNGQRSKAESVAAGIGFLIEDLGEPDEEPTL